MIKLLEGVKILDLTRLLPGGYSTQLLADMGAEVVKIEDLDQGDYIRQMGPPVAGGDGAYFYGLNRNKKSVRIDLKQEEGRQAFKRLVESFDILVEGFRPGVMDKLGLGYEKLRPINPGLIYCAITGYGQDGPYRLRAGHDINYISIAGILGICGKSGGDPALPAVQVADLGGGGLQAAVGILAAYIHRQRTGEGRYVDVSMLDGAFSWLCMYLAQHLNSSEKVERGRMKLNGGRVCYGVYRTKDGKHVSLGALEPKFWEVFCRLTGREDFLEIQHSERPEDFAAVEEYFSTKTRDEITALFSRADACLEPVLDLDEAVSHPQIVHRGLVSEMTLPGGASVRTIGLPIKFPGAETDEDRIPPAIGEQTDEVLLSVGYSREQIDDLRARRIVG